MSSKLRDFRQNVPKRRLHRLQLFPGLTNVSSQSVLHIFNVTDPNLKGWYLELFLTGAYNCLRDNYQGNIGPDANCYLSIVRLEQS